MLAPSNETWLVIYLDNDGLYAAKVLDPGSARLRVPFSMKSQSVGDDCVQIIALIPLPPSVNHNPTLFLNTQGELVEAQLR